MEILLLILAFALIIIGIIGAVVPLVPGPSLSYVGLLLLNKSGYANFSPSFLWIWAGITIVVTIMDYFLPSLLARKFGGSRAAAIGAFIGILAGVFILPPWGIIIGPFLGAFIGELIHNRKYNDKALKAACSAFLAFIIGSGAKLVICVLMLFFAIAQML